MTSPVAAALGALLLSVTLAGCGSAAGDPVPVPSTTPATEAPSPSESPGGGIALGGDELPPGWPEGLPAYEGGRVVSAVVTEDGLNVNAVWSSPLTPDEAWAEMDALLRAAGFVTVAETGAESMLVEDDSLRSDDYVGDGFVANVVVVSGEETSVLLNASRT